jgi:hypothetical protein
MTMVSGTVDTPHDPYRAKGSIVSQMIRKRLVWLGWAGGEGARAGKSGFGGKEVRRAARSARVRTDTTPAHKRTHERAKGSRSATRARNAIAPAPHRV